MMSMFLMMGLVVTGCDEGTTASSAPAKHLVAADLEAARTVKGAVRMLVASWLTPFTVDEIPSATGWHRLSNRDELLRTLEVVEVLEEHPFARALYQYSIGSTVCRKTITMQLVDGFWLSASIPYFSEYSPYEKRIHLNHQDFLQNAQERAAEWVDKQPSCWW